MATLQIAKADMDAFAAASGDLNPLHFGRESASGEVLEEPVVYGALTALAVIRELSDGSDGGLRMLDATFSRPLAVGVGYEVGVRRDEPGSATARIDDGDLPVARVGARFAGSDPPGPMVTTARRLARPAAYGAEELAVGTFVEGEYGGGETALGWVRERFGLQPAAVGDYALHSLLCASYLIGMALPGRGSTISSMRLTLTRTAPPGEATAAGGPLSYRASVVDHEPGLGTITLAGDIRHAGCAVARLTCEVHRARELPPLDTGLLEEELGGTSSALAGRTACVVGASRGLGAALAHGLASQGCEVYACSRSGEERAPAATAAWAERIHQVRGSGADPDRCRQLLGEIEDQRGGLDLLLCCGAPPLRAVGFAPASAARFNAFVLKSIELVSVPMATMLPALEARAGSCVMVSSEAVRTMPGEWGHYVAAKGASEALAAWAAERFPGVEMLVARMPQLVGGAPGSEAGVRVEAAAAWLVRRLVGRPRAGAHLLEWGDRAHA